MTRIKQRLLDMMNSTDENIFKPSGISTRDEPEYYVDPKALAIEFAKWVSNQQVLDDFWSMSREEQEKAYELFRSGKSL
jgi:uncharacterized protein YaeQ